VHLHQVPSVDSAKLLNVEKIKIDTLALYAKKNVCGACIHEIEKKYILLYKLYSRRAVIIVKCFEIIKQ
jgi:hypothetical protein